jgi:hypothetical protein
MSRIAEILYFAPGVRFSDLDLTGVRLPSQFRLRIHGFYLEPASSLARSGHVFAAGVLVVCALDALAQMKTGSTGVRERITAICRSIPDLAEHDNAAKFCEHFRNGLVHEARIKNGSEFSLEIRRVAVRHRDRLIVNPALLCSHTVRLLDDFVSTLHRDPRAKAGFCKKLKRTFRHELQN